MPQKCRVRNWSSYNSALKRRGDLFLYFEETFFEDEWHFKGKRKPGGNVVYSDVAIEIMLTIKYLFRLPLRQTQGFVDSLFKRVGIAVQIPDYSSLSRRAKSLSLKIRQYRRNPEEPLHLAIDATGLSIFTCSPAHAYKYLKNRTLNSRSWQKLHVAYDLTSCQVVNVKLANNSIHDAAVFGHLTNLPGKRIASIRADRAYDKRVCYVRAHELNAFPIIPPSKVARLQDENRKRNRRLGSLEAMEIRDISINLIREHQSYEDGIKVWKKHFDYHKRSRIEALNHRFKRAFGNSLVAKLAETRNVEVVIKASILNKQSTLPRAKYERIT
jgi:ribosomal protein L34E